MVLKYTKDQIKSLHSLIKFVLIVQPPRDRSEKILFVLMDRIRIKIRAQAEAREMKKSYRVTLKEDEALALEEWSEKIVSRLPKDAFKYEKNLLLQATIESNRLYGKIDAVFESPKLLH